MNNVNQKNLPLFNAILNHINKDPISFHVPGHKNGTVFPSEANKFYENVLKLDVTELTGLDDLHHPTGPISEAQALAADLYGSKHCFFLVGGSTVGNLAKILATCNEGDTVLVQRNSHRSIMNGLKLAKANPVFLHPMIDEVAQTGIGLSLEIIEDAIKAYPDARGLFLTNPNYYGMTIHLENIITLAQQHKIPVLVDEAHGAHFGIHNQMPRSAVHAGADIVIQSAHKTLPAMTMASYLHYNSELISKDKVRYYLQVLQSSSPSYPLIASLDLARYFLSQLTEEQVREIIHTIKVFRTSLQEIPQIAVLESNKRYQLDPLKVTIQSRCSLTGFELQALFEEEGIYTELADPINVLVVMPLSPFRDQSLIIKKIKKTLSRFNRERKSYANPIYPKKITTLSIPYKEMDQYKIVNVPLSDAIGKVVAEDIVPYPPGIPIVMAGEKAGHEEVNHIEYLLNTGTYFQGSSITKNGIKVFEIVEQGQSI